jgi:hypothetical protein
MPDPIRSDRWKAPHDKLQRAVAEIVSGDDWKRMLKVASKFHRYSLNNHLMIFLQRPTRRSSPASRNGNHSDAS